MFRFNLMLFVALLIMGCYKNEEKGSPCNAPIYCTLSLESIPVQVQYLTNDLKTLVTETVLVSTNEVLNTDTLYSNYNAIILTDMNISQLEYEGSPIVFNIYENGQLVSSVEYLIGHDCCHVVKYEGPDVITIP